MERNILVFDAQVVTYAGVIDSVKDHLVGGAVFWEVVDHAQGDAVVIKCKKTGATFALGLEAEGFGYKYDPDGDMISATTLEGSPSSSAFMPVISSDSLGARVGWVGFADAFLLMVSNPGITIHTAVHAGFIYNTDNKNDPDVGITGEAVLAGPPNWMSGTGSNRHRSWTSASGQSYNRSGIRIGPEEWSYGLVAETTFRGTNNFSGMFLGDRIRLAPASIITNTHPTLKYGQTRYVRIPDDDRSSKTVVHSADLDSDFAWLQVRPDHNTASGVMVPWRKGVTP